mgnify:FL=1
MLNNPAYLLFMKLTFLRGRLLFVCSSRGPICNRVVIRIVVLLLLKYSKTKYLEDLF